MSNNLFSFEGSVIRAVVLDDVAMFSLTDVCKVLGIANPSQVKQQLFEEDVKILSNNDLISNLSSSEVRKDSSLKLPNRGENFVTEAGLYNVIFMSRKEGALKFKKWVTQEVLPSINKTGKYAVPEETKEITKQDIIDLQAKYIEQQESKVKLLQVELDKSEEFWTINKYNARKQMHWTDEEKKVKGRLASKYSRERGIEIKPCHSNGTKYDFVGSYRIDVLDALFGSVTSDLFKEEEEAASL